VQFAKALNYILRTIGAIPHNNRYCVTSKVVETFPDCKPKTGWRFIIDVAKRRVETLKVLENNFGLIRTIIVDD